MGFFADQRIKNGLRATRSEDKAPMPKNRLNLNVKPSVMNGAKGSDIPVNQGHAPYDMDKAQQKRSKQSPR